MIKTKLLTLPAQPAISMTAGWLSLLLIFVACSPGNQNNTTIKVKEMAGINRDLEYVTVTVTADQVSPLSIREEKGDLLTPGQLLNSEKGPDGKFLLEYIFPVTIKANETKVFDLVFDSSPVRGEGLTVSGSGLELKLENSWFIADLTAVKATPENGLQAGQLSGLVLKQFNDQLLERGHIDMHWTPSFQKEDMGYKTMAHLKPDSIFVNREGPYLSMIFRKGHVKDYEEILVSGAYRFFAGLPYFTFSSEMIMEDSVELVLLRNNEMTMDSLFTHLMFPGPDGEVVELPLYGTGTVKDLDKNRIPDDVDWICFYNADLRYAFGSIRLAYDNTNLSGAPSPTFEKHTKLSAASRGGRYWDRRLIHLQKTLVPEGSRYADKNAYLIFEIDPQDPSAKIREYFQRLSNPLEVEYLAAS
ncbi:MAG: hypothetical protein F6K42_33715 [Leptolyngbya sp. SIO1D8]|nr:hypothetical protein [Leptolyngbya sp. SIO1D8]